MIGRIALLSMGLVVLTPFPVLAQVYGDSDRSTQSDQQQTQRSSSEPTATLGTVPGIYYDPSGQLSPSLSEMEGASEGGSISFEGEDAQNSYNIQRAWPQGATPDRIIKVGDVEEHPTLSELIDIDQLTLRQIAINGGAAVEEIPLKSVELIRGMTVAEFFEAFPELQNAPIKNVPVLAQTAAAYSATRNPQVGQAALTIAQRQLLGELANIDPRLTQAPLNEIVNGNWDAALAYSKKIAVQELLQAHPVLASVPITDVFNGDLEQVALTVAQQQVLEELAEIDPRLSQIPIREVLNGEWDGVLARVEKIAVQEIAKAHPALANTPIAIVLNGNLEQMGQRVLDKAQQELISELANNPAFENISAYELARGDWQGVLDQATQQQLQKILAQYPELANLPADKLFPIVGGVVSGDWQSVSRRAGKIALEKGLDLASQELLKAVPKLANAPLGALPIDGLKIGDISGLADKPLGTMPKIANRYLSDLGNFSQTPGTMMAVDSAIIVLTGDVFGRLDISYAGPVETPVTHVLTGGTRNQFFLPEPCTEESCKHFEISDVLSGFGGFGNVQGKAWVQGSSQSVPGGKGFLQIVNGGKERTGVPVWSTDAHVKLSLEEIDEGGNGKPATAQVWMNFQVCVYPPFMGEHCTPHFISMPTPWKVQEGGLMLVFSRASIPDFVQDAREQVNRHYESQYSQQLCDPAYTQIPQEHSHSHSHSPESSPPDETNQNLKQYLARITAGESGGGTNIGPNPQTGAYGEYQFTPGSRQLLMSRHPDLDPWSTNKAVRDRAAVKWIELYGQERGVDIIGTIQKGDFATADKVLGQHVYDTSGRIVKWGQFTSLPGGAEEHQMWRDPANLAKYGSKGNAEEGTAPVASANPCPPGTVAGGGVAPDGDGITRGQLVWPVNRQIDSPYGPRWGRIHRGTDHFVSVGTSIKAANGGEVLDLEDQCPKQGYIGSTCGGGWGNFIMVRHSDGSTTVYAHLNQVNVRRGQKVTQSQVIAGSGTSGSSEGPHLHFEYWLPNGQRVDPAPYLKGSP